MMMKIKCSLLLLLVALFGCSQAQYQYPTQSGLVGAQNRPSSGAGGAGVPVDNRVFGLLGGGGGGGGGLLGNLFGGLLGGGARPPPVQPYPVAVPSYGGGGYPGAYGGGFGGGFPGFGGGFGGYPGGGFPAGGGGYGYGNGFYG